jgi:hypothetical protein
MSKALFLDRDGTLIFDKVYLADPAGVELIPGVAAGLQRARDLGTTVGYSTAGFRRRLHRSRDAGAAFSLPETVPAFHFGEAGATSLGSGAMLDGG